jgi:hypothetical protein
MIQPYRELVSASSPAAPRHMCALTMIAAGALLLGVASTGHAQSEPPPPPPVTVEVAPPPPAPAPPGPPGPVNTEKPAAPPAEASFAPMAVAAWGRLALVLQGTDPSKLDDLSENGEVNLIFGGKVHKYFSVQADLAATFGPTATGGDVTGNINILDLIAQMEFTDIFNVWIGRMLVPSDRSNFSGPWFMAAWNYPGLFGPRQGPSGRNDGVTVWGQAEGGKYKYYLGAFDLFDTSTSPLITGRFNLALMDPEPGYLHSSSYYGKNMLTLGVGGQFKHNGSVNGAAPADDYSELNADLLYEHTLGNRAVLDLEGAVYGYFGDNEAVTSSFFALASYLVPDDFGIGKLQPLVRFQGATPKGGGDLLSVLDVQLGYVVNPYATRLALVYQRADLGGTAANAVIFGVQLQK